jgi:multicomponent Na+:H+ antiporter subunit E
MKEGTVSSIAYVVALAAIWVLLWGRLSVANVVSGVIVSMLLVALIPGARPLPRLASFRPVAVARLGVYLVRQLVVSNALLIREVLAPQTAIRTAIIGVPAPGCSPEVLTILANFMAMAPGTMPVEVTSDPPTLYVHVLRARDVERARGELLRLRDLTTAAFGGGR